MAALGKHRRKITVSPLIVDYSLCLKQLKRVRVSYSRFVAMCTGALAECLRRLPDDADDQKVRGCIDKVLHAIRCHDD